MTRSPPVCFILLSLAASAEAEPTQTKHARHHSQAALQESAMLNANQTGAVSQNAALQLFSHIDAELVASRMLNVVGAGTGQDGSFAARFNGVIVWFFFIFVFAYWYKSCDGKRNMKGGCFLPDMETSRSLTGSNHFSHGLFDCFSVPGLCIFSCCCGPVRWADTISMLGLIEFFLGIFIIFACTVLNVLSLPGTLLITCIYTYKRQQLRKLFGMDNGDFATVTEDFCTYCCCSVCAIVQEARQVETYEKELPVADAV
eukprot:TRINITY_DN2707_c0_g1_i2.p1 TRINITY_DN2707_c0_g1~~TRINITY_DN2707_c0_g1_i2.p1  ORF type:complete len:258 (-),score=28.80 TRINITY_DN2707_c0_g1_i2:111-884(-)